MIVNRDYLVIFQCEKGTTEITGALFSVDIEILIQFLSNYKKKNRISLNAILIRVNREGKN